MKQLRALCAILAVAAMMATAHADPAKIDDLAVGSIVTDGIKLHGILDSAPLPLPPGEWKVLFRKDDETRFTGGTVLPYVQLLLANTASKPSIPFMSITANVETGNFGFKFHPCNAIPAPAKGLANDFGSQPSQLKYLCGQALQTDKYQNVLKFAAGKHPIDAMILENKDALSGANDLAQVFIEATKSAGRNVFYKFWIPSPTGEGFKAGEPGFDNVNAWVKATGDKLGEFLSNSTVTLPDFPNNT